MELEAYTSTTHDKIQTDVLSQARQSCYKESNKKTTEIASVGLLYPVECKKPMEEYVKQCRPSWVKHFDRQYCAKRRVQRFLDDDESRRAIKTGHHLNTWGRLVLRHGPTCGIPCRQQVHP